MSHFSEAHTVTTYDAKKSQALSGQRLAKVRYKNTKQNPAKYPNVCVSVPYIDVRNDVTDFTPLFLHIRAMLENAQDGIIRSLYESHDGMLSQVTNADISIQACIAYMEAEAQGSRLTGDFIKAWFNESLQETVEALIAEKLGYDGELTPEQETTIEKHVNGYRELYASLAGGKTMLSPAQVTSMQKVIGLIDADETAQKLIARMKGMSEKNTSFLL